MEMTPASGFLSNFTPSFKMGSIDLLNPSENTTQSKAFTSIRITYYKPQLNARGKPEISYSITHTSQGSPGLIPSHTPTLGSPSNASISQNENTAKTSDAKWTVYALELAKERRTYRKEKFKHNKFQNTTYSPSPKGASFVPKHQTTRQPLQQSSSLNELAELENKRRSCQVFSYKPTSQQFDKLNG